MLLGQELTEKVLGAALEVHRHLGPGLLESAYEACLSHELSTRSIRFQRQVVLPVRYKGMAIDCSYRMDMVIENTLILEIKSVEKIDPVHTAQLMTYLKLSQMRIGILLNFNVPILKQGIVRRVL